jgi:protein-tyrosine-phosphatase
MAEAFARAYGSDVIVAASAGIHPAAHVASDTLRAMDEKNLDLRDHFTKSVRNLSRTEFDLIVNMSGLDVPSEVPVKEWYVPDPIGLKYEEHCQIRDQIERLVMELILELRRKKNTPVFRGQGSGRPNQ